MKSNYPDHLGSKYRNSSIVVMAFSVWISLGSLFLPCTAFLEAGVSSYLENTVSHVPEAGWNLVKPWATKERKGFFAADAAGGIIYQDRFVTPEQGIYFIALNLQLTNVTAGILKASLVINDEFDKKNGFEGFIGTTTSTETLSMSGFLLLYENDVIACYLSGAAGLLLPESTFSVMKMSRRGSVPGFHGVLSRNQDIQPQATSRLKYWTTTGSKGLFVMGSGTSPSVGLYCSIVDGIHKFTSNINLESKNQSSSVDLRIVLNSNTTMVKRYSSGTKRYSTSVSGMFNLKRGDCVEMRIECTSGGNAKVLNGTSFSGLLLGQQKEINQQFSVSLPFQNQLETGPGWNKVQNWIVNNSTRNFPTQQMILKTNHSTFISDTNGVFIVVAVININASTESQNDLRLLVSVNEPSSGVTGNSGLLAAYSFSSSLRSLLVCGLVSLNKGDSLGVYIYGDYRESDLVDGLFCVSAVPYDWPGVAASLSETIPLNSPEWTKLTEWNTNGVPGLFAFDNAFSPTNGVYRPHQDGSYFVSCNVIFEGEGQGNLSAIIAIDDALDSGNGLYALDENPRKLVTLNVAGSIKLRKSQNVSVYVKTTASSSWNISIQTGFSVVLIGADSLVTPGVFAVKQEISTCGEIGKWKLIQPASDSFFPNNARFDPASGKFKAEKDGLYLVSAVILIRHSGSSQIRMAIVEDEQSINVTTFQSNSVNFNSGDHVSTLTLSSPARLSANQKVSIFIHLLGQNSFLCKVLPNSSFSAVLVSRWESNYAAGFLTTAFYDSEVRGGYNEIEDWKSVSSVSKKYKIEPFTPIYIKSSGLYFVQIVFIVSDRKGYKDFESGICINGMIAYNGISASKVSAQKHEEFVISAFGVLFLRKKQKISPCIKSKNSLDFATKRNSWFSIVRFLPRRQTPGFHQILEDGHNKKAIPGCSVTGFMSTGGGQLAYVNGDVYKSNPTSPNDERNFTAPVNGTYLISLLITLYGNITENVTACIGNQTSVGCLVEISDSWRKTSYTFGFVGLLNLGKNEIISICLQTTDEASSLIGVTKSVEFRGGVSTTVQLKHNSKWLSSTGWQELSRWKTRGGQSVDKLYVTESGLYILSINLQLRAGEGHLLGVKLEARGLSNRSVLSVSANSERDAMMSYSAAVVARLNESETLTVSVYSDSQSLLVPNTTMYAALVTKKDNHSCLTLRSKTSHYTSGTWWKAIGDWENFDANCTPSDSDFRKGIFVAELPGIYFLATTVLVKTSHSSNQTRIIELLLSVNGDAMNTNGLKAIRGVTDGLSVVLSLSATAYLEQWQTLYLMIRSSGEGDFEVTNGSTFSVVLLEETRQYKTIANNITQFDKGPRIIHHPPSKARSLGGDLGLNVSWRCDAFAKGEVSYQWLKNNQPVEASQDLSIVNVQVSHSGQYVCQAEYDGIKVYSTQAELDVFDTTPQSENREFNSTENKNASFELSFSALDKERKDAYVSLVIVKGNTNGAFVLFPDVSQYRFSLRNQIPLDHEAINVYHLTLKATNQGTKKSNEVNVTIHILDDNDNPPIFHNRTEKISVKENIANGTFIHQVKAIDKDSGNNAIIKYSLLSREYDDNFFIDALSGNVSINGNLNHESRNEFTLLIQATDGKFRSNMTLLITILDVNEFQPVFYPQYSKINISEMASVGTLIIRVNATDKDSGKDARIHYKITSGNVNGTFSIIETNGTILLQRSLDYEKRSGYQLLVEASDGKFNSTANVSIQVEDVNDNAPYFTKKLFTATILDDFPIGSVVMNVTALDNDSGSNGHVTYSLAENPHPFGIIPASGAIVTLRKLKLNASRVEYRLSVIASDNGIPSNQTCVNVLIIVEDANDSPPVFKGCGVNSIARSTKPGQHLFKVSASDADYGSNANITYFIDHGSSSEMCSSNSNMFQVDGNGTISNIKELEENILYNITICATDGVEFDRCTVALSVNLPEESTAGAGKVDSSKTLKILVTVVCVTSGCLILGLFLIWYFRRRRESGYSLAKKHGNKAESRL
ncbi:uncharacterized protein LOC111337931 isoform X2 [Stylophora pistillata]|nr:uncharacterized protein LOC111337931 isoform X2 [Stylophora pistillata]XP_022800059.1 uncharacterized protein LOC111337931 isoform X2 [Stylophora pistillata]XP_022800060.1 uncharacterized protein LOC111337931 isoform X2 [Stylophora pistillata]